MAVILDVLVIGSGALGCATAFYLTEAGVRRVGVVDRGPLVSGMTRRNAGLVHTHHSSPTTTRLALQSLETYRHWAGLIGGSCGFVETGTLITTTGENGSVPLRASVVRQRSMGADTQILERDRWQELFPTVSFQGITNVAFEPAGGYVDPVLASQGFARRARDKGAKFDTGTLVKQISADRGRVNEVETTTGKFQAPMVIITAGAGAERLLAPLGMSLDMRGRRGAIGFFEQPSTLYGGHPTIIDLETFNFVRPHPFHLTAAGVADRSTPPKAADPWDESVSQGEIQSLGRLVAQALPSLKQASLKRAHAIIYDQMPDGFPVLGLAPGMTGLYVAAGFGQDAIGTAPAVGQALAELVVDGRAAIDIQEFRLERQAITHNIQNI